MKTLAINKNTKIMNADEFAKFMENKVCYHHVVNWIEVWKAHGQTDKTRIEELLRYFPYQGFVLSANVTLKKYGHSGYSDKCLSAHSISGRGIWQLNRWKVTIKKVKANVYYYVTKQEKK